MRKITLFFLFAFSVFTVSAQSTDTLSSSSLKEDSAGFYPEKQHFIPGNVSSFLADKMVYPEIAQKNGIEGRVIVSFIIEKNGTVSNIETVKGIGFGCDEEVERIIGLTSGLWSPGKLNGKPLRLKMMQPVFFELPSKKGRRKYNPY